MALVAALDLLGDIQRGGVRRLLRRLHDLRHKSLRILIGRAIPGNIDAVDRLAFLQALHILVDVDARSFAFVQAKVGRAFHAFDARRPDQCIAWDHRAVGQRKGIFANLNDRSIFQQRNAEFFEISILYLFHELVAIQHAQYAIERFDVIHRYLGRIDVVFRAEVLLRFAQLSRHFNAGKPAAADGKSKQALSFERIILIRSALKHMLDVRAQLDCVLIRPQRMRMLRRAFHAEEIRLAADRDEQIIKRIGSLCARHPLVCNIALGDLVRHHLHLAAAKDLSQIDLDRIRLGAMPRHFVELGHQRVKRIFIDQRNFNVIVLAEDFMQRLTCLHASIASADDEYLCFHIVPSRRLRNVRVGQAVACASNICVIQYCSIIPLDVIFSSGARRKYAPHPIKQ